MENKQIVNYADFQKLDIRIGTIVECEKVEGSEKLLKIILDFGEKTKRQILSGISKWYSPEDLIGKQVPAIINLEPRKLMGLESQGMIIMADNTDSNDVCLLHPNRTVLAGSVVS